MHRSPISDNLTVGTDVTKAVALRANEGLAAKGVALHGDGFIVTREKAAALGLGTVRGLERHIRVYKRAMDIMQKNRDVMAIDLFGLSEADVAIRYPAVYEHVRTHVKPGRDENNQKACKENWWLFGSNGAGMRSCLEGLEEFVAICRTAKYFVFQFYDVGVLTESEVIQIGTDQPWHLAVLSSHMHVAWALANGTNLGVGGTPRYNHTTCFNTFPFPEPSPSQKARLAAAGESLDAHRKARQAAHPGLTLTALYNTLAKVRAGTSLNAAESSVAEQGDVAGLIELHAEVDAATLDAYGWGAGLAEADLVAKLAALNVQRAAEETDGNIKWLRPDYQCK